MDNKKSLSYILAKNGKGKEKLERLLAQVQSAKAQCESDHSQFQERVNESYLYYTSRKPYNTLKNSNKTVTKDFVHPALFNSVKAALPQLLDSFTSDDGLAVAFRSRGYKRNQAVDDLMTYNLNKIFLRDNDGHAILEGLIKTTLIAGDSFCKVYVDETKHTDTDNLEDWVEISEYASSLSEGWQIDLPKQFAKDHSGSFKGFEWKEETKEVMNQMGEKQKIPVLSIRGSIPLIKHDKKIVVEEVEPGDIWFDTSYGSDFTKCRYVCHRIKTTVGEAKLRGFDPDKLERADDSLFDDAKLPDLYFSQVNYTDPTGGFGGILERNQSIDENERPISLYEHYIYSSIPHKKNETRLYQVVTSGDEILSDTEISHMPFIHGKCEPIQGSFFSWSFYDIAKPFQDYLSMTSRLFLEQGMLSVWPRYRAVKGQYDRGSLQNNTPGAVIEMASPESVQMFETFQLPQSFTLAHETMKQASDETLAQAVGFANSDGGVPQVATATAYLSIFQEALKGKVLTNNIKRTLVQPLFDLLANIVKEEGIDLVTPTGETISGDQLPNLHEIIVDPSTTHDDYAQNMQRQNVASFILQAAQFNSPVLTPQNIYAIAKDMLETSDLDSSQYLTDPSTQQDPQAQHKQALMEALTEEHSKVQLATAKINARKLAAETFKTEQEAEELVRNGQSNRTMKQQEIQAKIQQIISDAQVRSDSNQVKAQEVAVKNKQVNNDTIIAAHKQAYEINSNRVNGRLS